MLFRWKASKQIWPDISVHSIAVYLVRMKSTLRKTYSVNKVNETIERLLCHYLTLSREILRAICEHSSQDLSVHLGTYLKLAKRSTLALWPESKNENQINIILLLLFFFYSLQNIHLSFSLNLLSILPPFFSFYTGGSQ